MPELKLAFLENDKKYLILNRDLDIKRLNVVLVN